MSARLLIEDLTGGYGALTVFEGASFEAVPGMTLGILGANGAGKTTLLKTIVGLLPAQRGAVRLDTDALGGLPAYRRVQRGLALVPEGRQIIASLTVSENLELSRAATRLSMSVYRDRVTEVFEHFPRLRERAHTAGGALSGGEQQMLAIGRAMLLSPRVLMLDEPTQGLAPIVVQQVLTTLRALKQRYTMIVVEQNRAFLAELADRTLTMAGGRLL